MFKVEFISPNGKEYRNYKCVSEGQARKIAESTARKHGWKLLMIIKEY